MKDRTLRKVHRRSGFLLLALLTVQALSGGYLSLLNLADWTYDPDLVVLAVDLHAGGGTWASIYRVALAAGELVMALRGLTILVMIRRRSR